MVHIPSSMRTRSVGDELVGLRKAAGYSGLQMSRKLGWENSRLSRIEKGKYHATEVDITQWVTILGHPRSVLDELLAMLRQNEDGFVLQPHSLRLPDQLHTLIRHETKAKTIQNFELAVVPGLLQTKRYAHALISPHRPTEVDELVQARMDRQCMFKRPKQPNCTFYIHEFALRLVVGSREVMHDQVVHLTFMASAHGVSIRIVPASIGLHAGMDGAFMLIEHHDDEHSPLIFVTISGMSLIMDADQIVRDHRSVLEKLDRTALDEEQSRWWLVKLASEYDRPGEDPHALGLA